MVPSLKEIREILANFKPTPCHNSKYLSWAEALCARKESFKKKEYEKKKKLVLKQSALEELDFFYVRYKADTMLTNYKCSQANFIRMSQDVYSVSKIIFNEGGDIQLFFEHACEILNESMIRRGRVIYQYRGLDQYVRRMTKLRCFWEINMQNDGAIIDKREKEVKVLKKSLILVYDYMKRKVVDDE